LNKTLARSLSLRFAIALCISKKRVSPNQSCLLAFASLLPKKRVRHFPAEFGRFCSPRKEYRWLGKMERGKQKHTKCALAAESDL
jgi:hypothetical protein